LFAACRSFDKRLFFTRLHIRQDQNEKQTPAVTNPLSTSSAEPSPAQEPNPARIQSIDALKALAMFAVVCIHVPNSPAIMTLPWQLFNQLCRFGVPAFFIISGFFFMRSWLSAAGKDTVLIRYESRLLIPFLFWAMFYALVPPFVSGSPEGVPAALREHLSNIIHHFHTFLLSGYVYHLWFLSSLMQGLFLLWFCLRFLNLHAALVSGILLYSVALLGEPYANTSLGFHTHFDLKTGPFLSTLFVSIGALLAKARYNPGSLVAIVSIGLGLVISLAEVAFSYYRYGQPISHHDFLAGTPFFALGCVLLALARPTLGVGSGLVRLGRYSLGIYALHVYVIEVLRRTVAGNALMHWPLAFAILVFFTSCCLAVGLSKLRWTRRFVV
jgi:surface polysaccharide O-acyltransferase-like enzyme